ncbi:MAG: DMT family transporter [bacterium]|nr:DMT family transporter [bacterium]MDE0288198.1 DMT family transporter [bacterium]MDE0438148.1 DMT family transporter [bacterium]
MSSPTRQPAPLGLSRTAFGLLITIVGVLVLSFEGVLIRSIEVDSWTLLFLRGMLAAPGLFLFFLIVERRGWRDQVRSMGLAGLLAAVLFAIDNVGFIYSITHTSVANTLLLISLSPLFAGLFTRMVLRERVPRRTWLAIGGGAVATLIIMLGSLVEGDLAGTIAGFIAAAAIGGTLVVLRAHPHLNMVPAVALGSGLAALVGLPASVPSSADSQDWVYLVALGLIVVPVAFGLIATGPRYIPAAEVALFLLLETVLGALLVWAVIGEVPTVATVVGGLILVVVLAAHSVATLRSLAEDPSTDIAK